MKIITPLLLTTPLAAIVALSGAMSQAAAQSAFGNSGSGYGNTGPAQNPGSPGGLGGAHDADKEKAKEPQPELPPPVIPGAEPDPDSTVIPSDKVAAEMSPNDALFDAINRGDLNGAKDALNRGAQLEAHNVLGQTPTDAAIDLSRNDITFLLLSMRGASPSQRGRHGIAAAAPPAAAALRDKHGRLIATAQGRGPHRPGSSLGTKVSSAQLSADRGTPNAEVGFTGF